MKMKREENICDECFETIECLVVIATHYDWASSSEEEYCICKGCFDKVFNT